MSFWQELLVSVRGLHPDIMILTGQGVGIPFVFFFIFFFIFFLLIVTFFHLSSHFRILLLVGRVG